MPVEKPHALVLFSGGLDSQLVIRVLRDAGCEVAAISFKTPFFGTKKAQKSAHDLGIKIFVHDISEIHFQLLRNPPHGFGKNMNPCVDCHALMFRLAKEFADKNNFQIIASGEVLGQRPFSQNRSAMQCIEKITNLKDKILRPLSAKLLPVTEYERMGLVSREKMLDFEGRARVRQLALAKKFNLKSFPLPAGGCRLTDPGFSTRLKKLLAHDSTATFRDAELLKIGRVFFVGEGSVVIIGRNQLENKQLSTSANATDFLIEMRDFIGPTALLRIKSADLFKKVFSFSTQKIRNYGRESKKFTGKIIFNITGALEGAEEVEGVEYT